LSGIVPVKIWADTLRGAKELIERRDVRVFLGLDDESNLFRQEKMSFLGTGNLVEILSVVSYLRTGEFMPPQRIYPNILGKRTFHICGHDRAGHVHLRCNLSGPSYFRHWSSFTGCGIASSRNEPDA
jgi:hypothetical protein